MMLPKLTTLFSLALTGGLLCQQADALSVPRDNSADGYGATNETDTYDYIVVGSGPGGGPLAVNLAEAGFSVLLLEAGRNYTDDYNQSIPAFFGDAQWDEKQGWWFYTKDYSDEKQAARNSKMVWLKPDGEYWVGRDPPPGSTQLGVWYPRAGTLGGCDTHNGGLTVRPSDWDWDNIANLTGDASWRHEEMLRHFEHVERNLYEPKGTPGHGFDGFQPTGVTNKSLIEREAQIMAVTKGSAAALGFDERSRSDDFDVLATRDINEDRPDRDRVNDVFQIAFKRDEQGRRFSAGNRVSEGARRNIPLTVQFDSLVTRVVIDDDLRATGVEYLRGEKLYRADPRAASANATGRPGAAKARREVIVSGGAFNTPQILMLSGVGPAAHLTEHGIRVRANRPGVGRNLRDHYEVPVIQEFPRNFTFFGSCLNDGPIEENPCYKEWLDGQGPWTGLGFYQFVLYTSSVAPRGERDLILYGAGSPVLGHLPPYTNASALTDGINYYTYTISESHSRNEAGHVRLRSADPRDVPEINFEYFGTGGDDDVNGLVDGIELARAIFDAVPGGPNATVGEAYPGRRLASRAQLAQYVRDEAYGHHAAGTAAIGADDDPLAVLDSRFRVRGVHGLRVVDASVFPNVPGTFPLISYFIMSEKASRTILEDAE